MQPTIVFAIALALASEPGDSDASRGSVRRLCVGERALLEPPVEPGAGSMWVQLSGPDLLFRGGLAARASVAVRPRVAGAYRVVFLWGEAASLKDSPVVELVVAGKPRPARVVTGPSRAPAGEAIKLAAEPLVKCRCKPVKGRESWSWRQLSGPDLALEHGDASGPELRLVAEAPGVYVFGCSYSGNHGREPWAVHAIEIPARADGTPERRPMARVSSPKTAYVGEEVLLDGSRSADPGGDELVFRWTKVSGPPGDVVGEGARVRFFPAFAGEYAFRLSVADPAGFESAPEAVGLTVVPPPELVRPDPDAADPLDRPFSIRLEDATLSVLASRLSDVGVTIRASAEITEEHPFDQVRLDLWVVDMPVRKVLDWVGRMLKAFYVVEESGAVWYARGTRWLEREASVAATYRIDAVHRAGDASDLDRLLREAARGALWAGSGFSLGEPDLATDTVSAVLPKSAHRRLAAIIDELRREVASGPPPRAEAAALSRTMTRSVRASYDGWPARDIAWDLARQARVPVGFPSLGAKGGPVLSLDVGSVTFREALDAFCRAAGYLGFSVEPPGAVWLLSGVPPPWTSECTWSAAEVRGYDTRLLESAHGFAGPMLVHMVKSRVMPARWDDTFAAVGYSSARRRLVVVHSREVQHAVAAFLERLARRGEKALRE